MRTATAGHEAQAKAFSGGAGFKGLVVKTNEIGAGVSAVTGEWQTVDSRGFQIPAGESQLIAVDFIAHTLCLPNPETGGCFIRVLVGPTLGTAVELDPGAPSELTAIDSTANENHEGNIVSKALCVRNPSASPLNISVFVQAAKSHTDITYGLEYWTLKIARNAPCSPFVDL